MSNIQTITAKLWAMANELRGTMDASEYKDYILAFMFYRYLSKHQEQYLVDNDIITVADGQSVNDAYRNEATGDDLNDYLEENRQIAWLCHRPKRHLGQSCSTH